MCYTVFYKNEIKKQKTLFIKVRLVAYNDNSLSLIPLFDYYAVNYKIRDKGGGGAEICLATKVAYKK